MASLKAVRIVFYWVSSVAGLPDESALSDLAMSTSEVPVFWSLIVRWDCNTGSYPTVLYTTGLLGFNDRVKVPQASCPSRRNGPRLEAEIAQDETIQNLLTHRAGINQSATAVLAAYSLSFEWLQFHPIHQSAEQLDRRPPHIDQVCDSENLKDRQLNSCALQ